MSEPAGLSGQLDASADDVIGAQPQLEALVDVHTSDDEIRPGYQTDKGRSLVACKLHEEPKGDGEGRNISMAVDLFPYLDHLLGPDVSAPDWPAQARRLLKIADDHDWSTANDVTRLKALYLKSQIQRLLQRTTECLDRMNGGLAIPSDVSDAYNIALKLGVRMSQLVEILAGPETLTAKGVKRVDDARGAAGVRSENAKRRSGGVKEYVRSETARRFKRPNTYGRTRMAVFRGIFADLQRDWDKLGFDTTIPTENTIKDWCSDIPLASL